MTTLSLIKLPNLFNEIYIFLT